MTTTNEMTELPPLPGYVTPDYLEHLKLRSGCGNGKEGDCCAIQERRRWDGLDAKSDAIPETDSPVVGKLLIQLNDASDVWRAKLGPFLVKLRGSGRDERTEIRRALRLCDAALAARAALADRARSEQEIWPQIASLLDELLAMGSQAETAAT